MVGELATIKGFIPVSMLDWDGRLVSTLFLGGCNLRCGFCHNGDLVESFHTLANVSWGKVKEHLISKKGWLDGCVISGGEPCTNKGLEQLLSQIKELGYPVKLDTNGTLPQVLSRLIKNRLVDYVAMDVKASFKKYPLLAQTSLDSDCLKKSLHLIVAALEAGFIDAEFRTTVVPNYVEQEDLIEIAKYLSKLGASRYFLQQFNPRHVLEHQLSSVRPHSEDYLKYLADECSKFMPTTYRHSR